MRHPTEGVLRRLLDEPAGVADAGPRACRRLPAVPRGAGRHARGRRPRRRRARDRRRRGRLTSPPRGVASLLHRLLPEPNLRRAPRRAPVRPARSSAVPFRGALAVAVVVLTGAGAAAANDWLQIFRTEQIAPVSLSSADLIALPDLSAYGDLRSPARPTCTRSPTQRPRRTQTGLDVPEVTDLPRGVTGAPVYQVGDEVSATFTFSRGPRGRRRRRDRGAGASRPPGLDGSTVRLAAGPGVAQVWVVLSGRARPRRRSRRRADGILLRRSVRDRTRLSAVTARSTRGRRSAAANVHRRRLDPAAARPRRSGHHLLRGRQRGAGHRAGHPRPVAGGRRVGGRWCGDRRGRLAGCRRAPVDRQGPALTGGAGPTAVANDAAPRAAAELLADLPPAPAVWCAGLRKQYGQRPAVEDVSLEVGRGEVVRAARSERRRQDDRDQDAPRPGPP